MSDRPDRRLDPSADEPPEVPRDVIDRLRSMCLALPEAHEEDAWTGTRWRIRSRTFAHVLLIESGWPPAYARAAATDGPVCVLMVRSSGLELEVLRHADPPYFAPVWREDEVGLMLQDDVDWSEVAALITGSYGTVAPRKLARSLIQP